MLYTHVDIVILAQIVRVASMAGPPPPLLTCACCGQRRDVLHADQSCAICWLTWEICELARLLPEARGRDRRSDALDEEARADATELLQAAHRRLLRRHLSYQESGSRPNDGPIG